MPPKGNLGSDFTKPLMNTAPASSSEIKRSLSEFTVVQADAPKPKDVLFARAIASSMPATRNTKATGRKILLDGQRHSGECLPE